MAGEIIVGKPGSGKSYYTVERIAKDILDWCRFEKKEGTPFPRVVYTNIPLNVDEFNKLVENEVGKIDATKYIHQLTEADFRKPELNPEWDCQDPIKQYLYWWNHFPEGALAVIDEVHQYLGDEVEKGAQANYLLSFRNWFAQHRHKNQDVIFITQDMGNLTKKVRGVANKVYEITNMKSYDWGFPLNIPGMDFDIVRQNWGISVQQFGVMAGTFVNSRLTYDNKSPSRHVMLPKIFKLYDSHTQSMTKSDRPELNLGKWGSIKWFLGRHAWHLVPKLVGVILAGYVILKILFMLPLLAAELFRSINLDMGLDPPAQTSTELPAVPSGLEARTLGPSPPALPLIDPKSMKDAQERIKLLSEENESLKMSILEIRQQQSEVRAIFPAGVLTADGKKRKVGETVLVNGKEETINVINVKLGIVRMVSGLEISL